MIKPPPKEVLDYIQENYFYRDGAIDGPKYQDIGEFSARPDGKLIRRVRLKGKNYKVHHIVWYLNKGFWPTLEIDHIDKNTLNNKIENLREVTKSEQMENKEKSRMYKGLSISLCADKPRIYPYRVRNQRKKVNLGYFGSEEEAREAIDKWIDSGGKWWV